jgi:hypothetical protein
MSVVVSVLVGVLAMLVTVLPVVGVGMAVDRAVGMSM